MAKLYFKYGTMGSGKTLELLRVAYNYKERNQSVLVLTSSLDNRYGTKKIKSRVGFEIPAIQIENNSSIIKILKDNNISNINCILIDESQFLNKKQVEELCDIVDVYNIPVMCYGLKSDYKNEPFEGSSYLFSMCDVIEEIKSICDCGKKATINARISDGVVITNGEQILVGGNDIYKSLCRRCYKKMKNNEDKYTQ